MPDLVQIIGDRPISGGQDTDKLLDPVGINTAGLRGVIVLTIFQCFEMILKISSGKTSQMRIVLMMGNSQS